MKVLGVEDEEERDRERCRSRREGFSHFRVNNTGKATSGRREKIQTPKQQISNRTEYYYSLKGLS